MANAPLPERDGEERAGDLGQKGSGLFFDARLDRANRHETITENHAVAHVNHARFGRAFVRFAAHSGLNADIA
jgi:hypothetical protein